MKSTYLLIQLDKVTLRAGNRSLFPNTSWTIETGQHWAILGPNGSGKSLLASALCRQVQLSAGHIRFYFDGDGRSRSYFERGEVVRISPEDHAALTAGSYHQARWNSIEGANSPIVADLLTGESIEHFSAYQVGPTQISPETYRQRRERAVALLGIDHLLGRRLLHLSNGEGRKLLLARALMQSPHLLILDDPFGGLDIESRRALARAVDQLITDDGPQLLILTSRPDEIPGRIEQVLGVDRCRIAARGTREELLAGPFAKRLRSPEALSTPSEISFPKLPDRARENQPLVELKNTSITYDDVRILSAVDWTVRPGERWALLGSNGAGKSSLLSLILADNPQGYVNDITLFGRRRGSGESIWEIKRRIGWVAPELQRHYLPSSPCLRVVCSGFFDSVGLYRDSTDEQRAAARQWLRVLADEELADRPFGTVSAGEQRLVLLARALVKNPALLLLDEPCQGLDSAHRRRILHLLDALCLQTSIALVYVTHHPDEMPRAITHLLELDRGCVIRCGPIEQEIV
ncbi:MAG: ATP-binding cassette domain-containing protein [Gemmatimonadetes bacterium]|nr:ATP-binding cassette domain-containing protein [Gemmatimonadota bacterium]